MCRKASAMWVPVTKKNRTLFSEDPKNNINYRVSLILQYITSHNEMSWLVDSLLCSPCQDSKLSCLVYHSTVVAHLGDSSILVISDWQWKLWNVAWSLDWAHFSLFDRGTGEKQTLVNRSDPAGNQRNQSFTIVNCLEHELLEGFSVQEWQQSQNILHPFKYSGLRELSFK